MTCPHCKGRGYLLVSVGSMGQHSVPCYCGGEVSVSGQPKSEILPVVERGEDHGDDNLFDELEERN